jgi:hypothetical protein
MGENMMRPFAYAHSAAIMNALVNAAKTRRHYFSDGYQFIERAGEHTAFDKMIELAKEIGSNNPLYVDSVKKLIRTNLKLILFPSCEVGCLTDGKLLLSKVHKKFIICLQNGNIFCIIQKNP